MVRGPQSVAWVSFDSPLTLELRTAGAAFAESRRGSRCQYLGDWQPVALGILLRCGLTRCRFVPAHCRRLYRTGAYGEPAAECLAASVISLFMESTGQPARDPRVLGN